MDKSTISVINDDMLKLSQHDCPPHLEEQHFEGYRAEFTQPVHLLARGCPLGRAQNGYGLRDGAIADLLFRTSLDNANAVFYYDGQHGSAAWARGRKVAISDVRKVLA